MKYLDRTISVFVLLWLMSSAFLSAQVVTGHYGPGLFGLRSAHGFPGGWSYINVTHFYYAAEFKGNDGKISTLSEPINVIANISGGTWGRRFESIKANYNAALILPFTNLAPNPETLELDPDNIGLGDIKVIPLMLSWNLDRLAINTRYAFWAPTGNYEAGSLSNKGKGFWSHNFGLGLTGYLDKAKSWHLSWMNTLEFNGEQEGTSIRPPNSWVSEWGVGKTFDEKFNMGVVGYSNRQISNQTGGDLSPDLKKYKVNALGMEFNYRTTNKWVFITRWYLEYGGRNRTEGSVIRFIFLKNF